MKRKRSKKIVNVMEKSSGKMREDKGEVCFVGLFDQRPMKKDVEEEMQAMGYILFTVMYLVLREEIVLQQQDQKC